MNICRVCNVAKTEDRFELIKSSGNRRKVCRECVYIKAKSSPTFIERRRNATIKHRYGLSPEKYQDMFEAQNGLCMICKNPEVRTDRNNKAYDLCVDHDHRCCPGRSSCGKCVRGLLCHSCNAGVGYLRDDLEIVRATLEYLEKFRE